MEYERWIPLPQFIQPCRRVLVDERKAAISGPSHFSNYRPWRDKWNFYCNLRLIVVSPRPSPQRRLSGDAKSNRPDSCDPGGRLNPNALSPQNLLIRLIRSALIQPVRRISCAHTRAPIMAPGGKPMKSETRILLVNIGAFFSCPASTPETSSTPPIARSAIRMSR